MIDPFSYRTATAIVTGGSSGIGRAIAHALVVRGVPRLMLVARGQDRLDAVAAELAGKGTIVETISLDLAPPDAGTRLMDRLAGQQVDLLVNAAGLAAAGPFAEETRGAAPADVLAVNAGALTTLSAAVLPGMRARGAGGILNVASTAGEQPVPFSAVYGASKAYVLSLTRALWAENLDSGVRIAGVVPGVTRTNLGGENTGEVRGGLEKLDIAEPEDVAETALDALDANDPARIYGARNATFSAALGLLPDTLAARVIAAFKG